MTTTLTTPQAAIKAKLDELNSEHESLLNALDFIKEELLSKLRFAEQEEKERDRIAKNTQKLDATEEERERLSRFIEEHNQLVDKLSEVLSEIRALDGKCSLSLIKPNGCRVSRDSVGLCGVDYNERFEALKPTSYIEIDPKNL